MLSYRHAFHAGNHADVLKHLIEYLLLDYLKQKPKPICYIDTHAGPGMYSLVEGFATKNAEFENGIAGLWGQQNLPEPLANYVALIARLNQQDNLQLYPGSPAIARELIDKNDRMCLFELHPDDAGRLSQWAKGEKCIRVEKQNGFEGLIASLPPKEKRGLIMIDPPYEVKTDYQTVVAQVQKALKRFATGVYAIWYPVLDRPEVGQMVEKLKTLPVKYLHAQFMAAPESQGGMYGSGMFVINPSWVLEQQLKVCEPALNKHIVQARADGLLIETKGLN